MKVILLQDVAKIGRRFDVVNVPDGHALNFLIPKGLAKAGTPENIKQIEAQKAKTEAGRQAEGEAFAEASKQAAKITLEVVVPANDQGHLFEALKAETVAQAYTAAGVMVAAANVHFGQPIKETGEHTIELVSGQEAVPVKLNIKST